MKKISFILALAFLFTNIFTVGVFGYSFNPPVQSEPVSNQNYVTPDFATGKLIYTPYDSKGSVISDYTSAGYFSGEYELPVTSSGRGSIVDLGTVYPKTWTDAQISNGEADDAYYINEAINNAAAMVKDNQIAVVKLAPGKFYIPKGEKSGNGVGSIQMKSNVILSGSGQGPTGTVLYAYETYKSSGTDEKDWGTAYKVIGIAGTANSAGLSATKTRITEEYIEAGSYTFKVASAAKYSVGDLIRITLPRSDAWSEYLEMDNALLENSSTPTGWSTVTNAARFNRAKITDEAGNVITPVGSDPDRIDVRMERTITAINGNEITVDMPFFVHVEKRLEDTSYPYEIMKLTSENKVENIGIENLRIESKYDTSDSNPDGHASYGVSICRAKNCYVQNVTFKHMRHSAVYCHGYVKQITVRGCSSIDPKSTIDGGYRYTYGASAEVQQYLVNGSYAEQGRHDYQTSYTASGPIVFVDNVADKASTSSETHGVWSTGVLFDNIIHIGDNTTTYNYFNSSKDSMGLIASANRGRNGTKESQGWTGAGTVIWNSLAPVILVHDVPGDYQNFVFGIWGYYDKLSGTIAENNVISRGNLNHYKTIYHQDSGKPSDAFKTYSNSSIVGNATIQSVAAPVEPRSLYKAQLAEKVTGNFTNAKDNAPTIVNPEYDSKVSSSVTVDGIYEKGATKVYVYIDNEKYEATLNSGDNSFSLSKALLDGTHKIYATQVIDGDESCKTPDRFVIVGSQGSNYSYLSSEYSAETLSLIKNDTRMTYDEYLESFIIDELPETLDSITTVITGSQDGSSEITIKNQNNEEQTISGRYVLLPAKVVQKRGYTIPKSNYGFLISDDGKNWSNEYPSALMLKNDAYGICFYNLARVKNKYWFKQYVTYVDEDGESYTVYSEPYMHEFK